LAVNPARATLRRVQLIAILSGLAAALSWGAGDFAGGLASRRAAAVRVVLVSQLVGGAALIALGLLLHEPRPDANDVLMGALAGLAGGLGLLLLYLSLARGKMGVAAPLTAVASGGIPLLVGLVAEGLPGAAQMGGFALALLAIWVISRPDEAGDFRPRDAVLPLLAGVGFGTFLAIIGRLGEGAGFVWPLVAARVASVGMLAVVVVVQSAGERGHRGAVGSRSVFSGSVFSKESSSSDAGRMEAALPRAAGRGDAGRASEDAHSTLTTDPLNTDPLTTDPLPTLPLAALAGLGDTAGNAFFALSAAMGRLDVAAVLGALYPAATVVLARVVLGERLSPRQSVGVGLALGAVTLIAL